jgi:diguanylate cyclase (GGDEF)-like protein
VAEQILGEDRGSFSYERGGETYLLTTRYLPELKWYLFVELPEDEATKGIRRGFVENLLIGFVVIGITLGLIIASINKVQRQLEEMAVTDKLTGLGNRQAFDFGFKQALSRIRRTGEPLSLMMIDLDHFKAVNDTFGHAVGDETIRNIAKFVRSRLREMDVMCRWGGEEFVVLMPTCTIDDAFRTAEKIRAEVAAASFVGSAQTNKVTISIGVSQAFEGDGEDALMSRADAALYAAKDAGRNRVERA